MRVLLVTGSRALADDRDAEAWATRQLSEEIAARRPGLILCGDARGGDELAVLLAQQERISVTIYTLDGDYGPPSRYRHASGRMRVVSIADGMWWDGKPQRDKRWPLRRNEALVRRAAEHKLLGDAVAGLALYATPQRTGGTLHTTMLARSEGIPVREEHFDG